MSQGFHDFTSGSILTAADLEDYCELQGIMRFASAAARATALSGVLIEGLMCYLIDLNVIQVYSGSAWSTIGPAHGALTNWTPTVTQSGSVTLTVNKASYQRIGRQISGVVLVTVTGAGSANNAVVVGNLPATGASSVDVVGAGYIRDTSVPSRYPNYVVMASTTTFQFYPASTTGTTADTAQGITGSDFAVALAVNDTISFHFSYEAASDA